MIEAPMLVVKKTKRPRKAAQKAARR